jgi:pyridoxal phosphate enzyme (YggS family)
MSIEGNIKNVRDRIAEAAIRSGREASDITLVAVSKFVEASRIIEAYEAGIRHFGENRMQELTEKMQTLGEYGINWNFIGRLQTHKVKYIDGRISMVQSVDRIELIEKLDEAMSRKDTRMRVLLQVNIGNEPQKGGISGDKVVEAARRFGDYPNLELSGLMCIPPNIGSEDTRHYFIKMRDCFRRVQDEGFAHADMKVLSMGMSEDYEAAIEEGANMVRIGSLIFK